MDNCERVKTEYLCYLMNRAQMDAEGSDGYSRLCKVMQDTEFLPIHERDENRCSDCRRLRKDFADAYYEDERDGIIDILDGEFGENGTMMEVTLVLAEYMQYEMADSQYEAGVGKWFREMLCNCGLNEFVNERFERDTGEEVLVKAILDTVIFRRTGWDGEGGYFPLMYPQYDQRVSEMIIQANNYLEENYDIC